MVIFRKIKKGNTQKSCCKPKGPLLNTERGKVDARRDVSFAGEATSSPVFLLDHAFIQYDMPGDNLFFLVSSYIDRAQVKFWKLN